MNVPIPVQTKAIPGDALQYDGTEARTEGILAWCGGSASIEPPETGDQAGLWLNAVTGYVKLEPSDWVLHIAGEYEVATDEEFRFIFENRP